MEKNYLMAKRIHLAEQKQIILSLLSYIEEISNKHGIEYSLIAGTLLGAIRHEGFIPWDDDADVALLRDDYERLVQAINDDDTHPYYKAFGPYNHETGDMLPFMTKLVDTRTFVKSPEFFREEFGVFVDIFPIDKVPNKGGDVFLDEVKHQWYEARYASFPSYLYSTRYLSIPIKLFLYLPRFLKYKQGGNITTRMQNLDNYVQKYNQLTDDYYYRIVFDQYEQLRWEPDWVKTTEKVSFESLDLHIFTGYDAILKNYYGDYMKLPPISEQKIDRHTYRYYWRDK